MTLDDQKLDQLLRDVDVPAELKPWLLSIGQTEPGKELLVKDRQAPIPSSQWVGARLKWIRPAIISAVAVAATIGGLILFVSIQNTKQQLAQTQAGESQVQPGDSQAVAASERAPQICREIKSQAAFVSRTVQQLEIDQLRRRLAAIRSRQSSNPLEPREQRSMIASLTAQAGLDWGAKPEAVKSEMLHIVQQYPDSIGANMATAFLEAN